MKYYTLLLITLVSTLCCAQNTAEVSEGSIGFGLHVACPQSELKDINYDDGFGLNLSYLSRGYPYKSKLNFQMGARMDFASMQSRTFDSIAIKQPASGTAIIGDANVKASNRMYGFFGLVRLNWGTQDNKFVPYVDIIAGHRNYNTYQYVSLNEPKYNPEYESSTLTNKVVYTKRFHYGGSLGLNYRVSPTFSLETSVTYTIGERGAALPLGDIERLEGSNEINYANFQRVKTDMLLINAGIRIHLFKNYSHTTKTPSTNNTNTPKSTRYKDTTPC